MALFKSVIFGPISGALAGIVFSHNKGGQYIRARSTPTDPGTVQQTAMRNAIAVLSSRWASTLTQVQRDAWDVYAANVPRPDRIGGTQLLSGIAMYIRSNSVRLQADPIGSDLPIVDDGPTTFNVGSYTIPIVSTLSPFVDLSLLFTGGEDWQAEDGAAMIAWTSRPVSPSKKFFKGPYRVVAPFLGNSTTPLDGIQSTTAAFPWVSGGAAFAKLNVTRADGRLGDVVRVPVVFV